MLHASSENASLGIIIWLFEEARIQMRQRSLPAGLVESFVQWLPSTQQIQTVDWDAGCREG